MPVFRHNRSVNPTTDRLVVQAVLRRATAFRAVMRQQGVSQERLTFCITGVEMRALSRVALKLQISPVPDAARIGQAGLILGMSLAIQPFA